MAQFPEHIERALDVLHSGLPRRGCSLASIPDLYRLWQIGHTDDRAVRAWSRGICPALLANPRSTALDDVVRTAFRKRVEAYNAALAAACRRNGSRSAYDGGAVHRARFDLTMLNPLDYFASRSGRTCSSPT